MEKSLKPQGLILCIEIKSKSNQTERKMMLLDKEIIGKKYNKYFISSKEIFG